MTQRFHLRVAVTLNLRSGRVGQVVLETVLVLQGTVLFHVVPVAAFQDDGCDDADDDKTDDAEDEDRDVDWADDVGEGREAALLFCGRAPDDLGRGFEREQAVGGRWGDGVGVCAVVVLGLKSIWKKKQLLLFGKYTYRIIQLPNIKGLS